MSKKPGFTKVPGGIAGQGISDIKEGIKQGGEKPDYSRISSYHGDKGVHTGSDTPTTARGGKPFNKK